MTLLRRTFLVVLFALASVWPASATIYISDTFTDTNGTAIASHTPDTGGAWNTSGAITITSNQLICGQFGSGHPYNSTTSMASADYEVLADIVWSVAADGNADMAGVLGRYNNAAADYYAAYYNTTGATWKLSKFISGGETSLGTSAMTYTQGQTHALKLRMQGSTITMFVDGTSLVSVTDTAISAKNNAGIYMEDVVSQAQRVDNYVVQDIAAGGGVRTPTLTLLGVAHVWAVLPLVALLVIRTRTPWRVRR